jgi:hypothetical protein
MSDPVCRQIAALPERRGTRPANPAISISAALCDPDQGIVLRVTEYWASVDPDLGAQVPKQPNGI